MKKTLIDILACPVCKGPIILQKEQQEFICRFDKLAFPVKNDIPVMIPSEERQLTLEELEKLS